MTKLFWWLAALRRWHEWRAAVWHSVVVRGPQESWFSAEVMRDYHFQRNLELRMDLEDMVRDATPRYNPISRGAR